MWRAGHGAVAAAAGGGRRWRRSGGPGRRRVVWELHGGEWKLARRSIGGEERRGRGLRGEVVHGGGYGGRGGVPERGEGSGGSV